MMNELQRDLGRIEGKIDILLAEQGRFHDRLNSHSARIRRTEQKLAGAVGWAAGASAIISLVVSLIFP